MYNTGYTPLSDFRTGRPRLLMLGRGDMRHGGTVFEWLASRQGRIFLAVLALTLYLITCVALNTVSPSGPSATGMAGLAAAVGWLLGRWPGVIAGLLTFPLNVALLSAGGVGFGDSAWWIEHAIACVTNVIIGLAAGWSGDLYRRVETQARELARDHECLSREVTERKLAEDRLRDSEEVFRLIAENSADMISLWDPDGKLVYCSPAYSRMFGRRPPAELHVALADLFEPDGSDALRKLKRATEAKRELITIRIRDAEGHRRWVEVFGAPVPMRNDRYVMVVARDITERQHTEAALREGEELTRRILESVPAGIVMVGTDGRVIEANGHAMRYFGLTSDQLQGIDVSAYEHTTFREDGAPCPAGEYPVTKCLRTGVPQPPTPIGVRLADGQMFWGLFSATPAAPDPHTGKPTGAVAIFLDITERRQLEQQLRQAQKMDAVGRLAGGVAHDFNNLLTVINGYGELLLDSLPMGTNSHALAGEVAKAGGRAAALTRQLLAFGHKQVVALQTLDLNGVLTGMRGLVERMLGEDVEVLTALTPGVLPVRADATQLEQVILNLVVNARDAMPEGGSLTLATAAVAVSESGANRSSEAHPGVYIALEVTDTGVGMTEAVRARLFEPFFTTKGVGKGTGLGLATVYGIVKQCGGHIEVTTVLGSGTTFRVFLPRSGEAVTRPEAAPRTPARGAGEVILLAEDEPLVRNLVVRCLRIAGYDVLEARTAQEAALICDRHEGPIHLLLTDVIMPQLSGPALARQAQARRSALKVLYMSGHTDDAVLRRGIRDQGVPFLQKPFTPDTLARKIREVLDA